MKNQIITPRNQPLEFSEFEKLDSLAEKNISFKPRFLTSLVWVTDEYGDKNQKRELTEVSPELFAKGDIEQALLDSLCRSSTAKSTIIHLSRLNAHKPYGRGNEGWSIVLEDLCKDLNGVSEYAVIKACEHFRKDEKITFFPDTAVLQRFIRDLDSSLKQLCAEPVQEIEKQKEPEFKPDGIAGRQNVAKTMHSAGLPHDGEFCEICKTGEAA